MGKEREAYLRLFREQEDYIKERVAFGIEQYRKGRFNFTVVDSKGIPIPDAKVSVKQKGHEFRIGTNLFAINEMENEDQSNEFKRLYADCFNIATLPFYWKSVEPERGKTRFTKDSPHICRRPTIDSCLEFCEQYNVEPKAHCLDYDLHAPAWYKNLNDVDSLRSALYDRFRQLSELYADRIPTWEVTNEVLVSPELRTFTAHFLSDDMLEWDFRTADKFFPKNKLIINEAQEDVWLDFKGNRSSYYMLVERALRNGCRIDSIGMQFHVYKQEEEFGKFMYSPTHLYKVMDRYADFNLPIQITEASIACYEYGEDDEIQAEILKNLYSIWFSHPAMEAIIYWDFVDGYDWKPSDNPVGYLRGVTAEDGERLELHYMERPQIYLEDGKPFALLCACMLESDYEKHARSFNIRLSLDQ